MPRIDHIFNFISEHSLVIGVAVIVVTFLAFYPANFINIDEFDYARNTELLLTGELKQECKPHMYTQYQVNDYCISKYNIGTSLLLIPATLVSQATGLQLLALSSLVAFIIGIIVFSALLKDHNLDPIFTYLFAFYPVFTFFSRTILSEIYSATLIIIVFWALTRYMRRRPLTKGFLAYGLLTGAAAGLAVIVRYTNVIPLTLLILSVLITQQVLTKPTLWTGTIQLLKRSLAIVAGGLPFLIALLLFNNYLYGSYLRSGYYFAEEEGIYIIQQVPQFIVIYLIALSLNYPGMIWAGLLSKYQYRWAILLAAAATILFYAGFPNTVFEGRLEDLILGLRFLVPILPLLIFLYVEALQRLNSHKYFSLIACVAVLILFQITLILSYIHYIFLMPLV